MLINEVTNPLKKFIAVVRVKGSTVKTLIHAESEAQARLLLAKLYGNANVGSVSLVNVNELKTVTPLSTQAKHEAIINNLTQRVTRSANRLRPTQQDFQIAVKRYKTNQKRSDLEYKKQQELAAMRKH